uniref:Uncharacterized protein n=1 Tax=Phaeomonas parva TaxID=124430 RepID=A0A7S1TY90_9STRA
MDRVDDAMSGLRGALQNFPPDDTRRPWMRAGLLSVYARMLRNLHNLYCHLAYQDSDEEVDLDPEILFTTLPGGRDKSHIPCVNVMPATIEQLRAVQTWQQIFWLQLLDAHWNLRDPEPAATELSPHACSTTRMDMSHRVLASARASFSRGEFTDVSYTVRQRGLQQLIQNGWLRGARQLTSIGYSQDALEWMDLLEAASPQPLPQRLRGMFRSPIMEVGEFLLHARNRDDSCGA